MKQQEMTERTIQKLVDAGIVLFAKYGYSNTSVDQIVKEAGLSKGAFYAHFATKEDFLMKVLRDGISFYFEDLRELLTQENRDLVDDFVKFSTDMVVKTYEKGFSAVLLHSAMTCQYLPQVQQELAKQMEEWRQDLTQFIEAMRKEGLIGSPLDARTLATAAMALFNGYNMQHYIDDRIDIMGTIKVFYEMLQIRSPK
ncbi:MULTISPECIES: TetR/AcrR family transcriptional regulator [Thermoactinomyces]|jgi:TetR/AcrR family transcriptional regulator, transcriptional repressor for nem operon|uniref:TetR/AcrR family transcriptional regulator n=1 Tax=Thermoactinomyces daqus TaxID=1329516 RepID=A0A7W1XCV5_9BACL|nr:MULTISPECIES: TetR/AcrR family transcriptional regulator [Thermoactinomyces]MBA4544337.1 TetR/AcrR family transcriptional regulator [Thermoactinomyces daqus]MBH8599422.1 TetR/AcrR family transcriptional regulator [Thermoactinomyces sp. CICC 10523]MBH8605205.1 TetR/AcrR family transcriptional regulator [Thermoactinomyces sp. CICC 10522]MBH8609364.1 TetR/AcrR family transcriptional regulator [Thermoactinomyces sp. CICC 10521]